MYKTSWLVLLLPVSGVFVSSRASAANLVINGGFETGNFQGWTTVAALAGSNFGVSRFPHTGSYAAEFGGVAAGDFDAIYQDLTTTPGSSYALDFWLKNGGNPQNDFQVYWGGSLIMNTLNSSLFGYTEYTYILTASKSSTQLLFQGYQLPSHYFLDDVSVTSASVPEPSTLMLLVSTVPALLLELRRR